MAEIIHEVHLELSDTPLTDENMGLIVQLLSLKYGIEDSLRVCPSGELISERYRTEKAKLEEIIEGIDKRYGLK